MPDELSELQENAEHGRENPSSPPFPSPWPSSPCAWPSFRYMGHRSHTEELLTQNRATDQWAYYQAKNIRLHNYQMSLDLLALVEFKDKEQSEKVRAKYQSEVGALHKGAGRNRGAGQGLRRRIRSRPAQSGPLRSRRSVSRNCPGHLRPSRFLSKKLISSGYLGILSGGRGPRCRRLRATLHALKSVSKYSALLRRGHSRACRMRCRLTRIACSCIFPFAMNFSATHHGHHHHHGARCLPAEA